MTKITWANEALNKFTALVSSLSIKISRSTSCRYLYIIFSRTLRCSVTNCFNSSFSRCNCLKMSYEQSKIEDYQRKLSGLLLDETVLFLNIIQNCCFGTMSADIIQFRKIITILQSIQIKL